MDNNYFNPQLSSIQTQMQQLQNILSQKPQIPSVQQTVPQMTAQSISFVDGINGAREYLKRLPANSSAAVFDNAEAIFYTLSTDANGIAAPIKMGKFVLEDVPEPGSDNITKQDFDAFKAEIRDIIANMTPKTRKKEVSDE